MAFTGDIIGAGNDIYRVMYSVAYNKGANEYFFWG